MGETRPQRSMPLVYASRDTSRCLLQDSRSGWIRYFLSCRALASPTTCRFIPALSEFPVTRARSRKKSYRPLFALSFALREPNFALIGNAPIGRLTHLLKHVGGCVWIGCQSYGSPGFCR